MVVLSPSMPHFSFEKGFISVTSTSIITTPGLKPKLCFTDSLIACRDSFSEARVMEQGDILASGPDPSLMDSPRALPNSVAVTEPIFVGKSGSSIPGSSPRPGSR